MKKTFLIFLFYLVFFNFKVMALTGEATTYGITMTRIELCDSTSTDTACNGSVILYSGNSGVVDIASTTAGAAAASLGNLSAAQFGTTYTYLQITMERAMSLGGTVVSGSDSCSTIASNGGTDALNGKGAATATEVSGTYYAGVPGGSSISDFINSTTAGDGTGTDSAIGAIDSGDDYFEWREKLTAPISMVAGKIPTVEIAFGTTTALGYLEQAGMNTDCTEAAAANQGFYGNIPDITITIK